MNWNRGTLVGHICEILVVLAERRTPIETRALVEATGINRRQLYRYLEPMETAGLVVRGPYKSSPQVWSIGPLIRSLRRAA